MKKHKFLALGLAAMMSMSVFAGCGQGASTSGSTGTVSSGSAAQTSEELSLIHISEPTRH